jgi:glucose/mannose transport system substrate-binding protein
VRAVIVRAGRGWPPAGIVAALTLMLAVAPGAGCGRAKDSAGSGQEPAGVAAPGEAAPPGGLSERRPIEMFSWWERVGKGDALGALIKQHQKDFPGDVIINASAGLSGLARKTLRTRMQLREPPDTFQANVGADLMQWVIANRADARESKLAALDDILPDVAEWRRQMPAQLVEQVSYGGKMYGVPSNVHRINSLFYSKKVFEKYGLTEPKTVADFDVIAKKLKGTGVSVLAVGSKEPWTLALLAFESLLVSREGPTLYNDYLHGKLKADDPRVVQALAATIALGPLFNADHAQRNWLQAIELVARGQAAMTPMGDWAAMFFNAQGMVAGKDYGEIAFPGSESTFVFTSDAFALPVEAKNRPGALRLLRTIGSPAGQQVISRAKGALSPRADVPPAEEDPTMAGKHALWQKGSLVLALSGIVPPRFSEDLAAALSEMLSQRDVEPVVHMLRSRYALLK